MRTWINTGVIAALLIVTGTSSFAQSPGVYGAAPPFSTELAGKSLILTSGVSFSLLNSMASYNLSLKSSIRYDPSTYRYIYTLKQDSRETLLVDWGIILDNPDFALGSKTSIRLASNEEVVFTFESNSPPKWGIGRVGIRNLHEEIIATGLASSYGPSNGVLIEPEWIKKFWENHEKGANP